jgi:hypothetical protein
VFSLFFAMWSEGRWDGSCEGGVSFLFARVWMPEPPNGCEIHTSKEL